jgi:hypothetical protein
VLTIFFDVEKGGNSSNPFIESLKFENFSDKNIKDTVSEEVLLMQMLSRVDTSKIYNYQGSFTSPIGPLIN